MKKFDVGCRVVVGAWLVGASLIAVAVIKDGFPGAVATVTWDLLKTIFGPFVGAALAFYANNYFHKERKTEVEQAAAMGAIFSLNALYDDFLNYRFAWRQHLAQAAETFGQGKDVSLWLYSKPMMFAFRDSVLPSLDALQFLLLSQMGGQAYQDLQAVERAYRGIREAHKLLNEATIELQTAYATARGPNADIKKVTEAISPRILRAVESLLTGLVVRLEKDSALYEAAIMSLRATTTHRFGHSLTLETERNEKFEEKNLPPLPKVFAKTA